jgi:site-specific recombinase XerD
VNKKKDGTETVTEKPERLSARTINKRKEILKPFFKWLRQTSDNPPEIKGLKSRKGADDEMPIDSLLTRADLAALLQACPDLGDKAKIAVLYDSGLRAGEFCALNIGSVAWDQYGATITLPKGAPGLKTGARRVRIFESVPFLHAWFEAHPQKTDPRAPLFLCRSNNRAEDQRLTANALWYFVSKTAARAGLKKDVWPHLFRHTAATDRARLGWNEGQMRAFFDRLGFATIPLRPREKRPLRKGWREAPVEHWKDAPADANLGIVTGSRSGDLVVLDFDERDGPERVLGFSPEELAFATMVVETSRGWHVYVRSAGVASSTPREGLDVRGEGGMVVAPPNVHPSGHAYHFLRPASTVVALEAIAPTLLQPSAAPVDDLAEVESWIALQSVKLQAAWGRLRAPPSMSFDASKADFAVACCLAELGYEPARVAAVLLQLPGSRARERGEPYALLTAERARRARLSRRRE